MNVKIVRVVGAPILAASVAVHGEKHFEVASYHGEPQPTRALGESVNTASVSTYQMFNFDWDFTIRQFE